MTNQVWPEIPELAAVYDTECAGRSDHDFYLEIASELDAATVIDVGCGTGVFSVDVARKGRRSIGIDPARPMLDIARNRPGGDLVAWIEGTAADGPVGECDLVIMMGHVAQYFVDDAQWTSTLQAIHRLLRPGGHLAFEARNPAVDWARLWTKVNSRQTLAHPEGGTFESWVQVVDKVGSPDSYQMTHEVHAVLPDGRHLWAAETLRFRSLVELRSNLHDAGFAIEHLWGDWDRSPVTESNPEFIFVAQRCEADRAGEEQGGVDA